MKNRIFKIACFSILMATLFSGISFAGTWVKTGSLWRYRVGKHFYRNQWAEIDGEWYYFKPTGSMARNQEIDGKYLGEDGKRDQAQEQAMAEAARQAKIQEAKNKGYTVIQGRVEIWTYYDWIKTKNYEGMYYTSFKDMFNKQFGILDFVKPERVWMEYAGGDPSRYVTLEGVNFSIDTSMKDYMEQYNGKTVYAVFKKKFEHPSDVSVPEEEKYLCGGMLLYIIE